MPWLWRPSHVLVSDSRTAAACSRHQACKHAARLRQLACSAGRFGRQQAGSSAAACLHQSGLNCRGRCGFEQSKYKVAGPTVLQTQRHLDLDLSPTWRAVLHQSPRAQDQQLVAVHDGVCIHLGWVGL